MLNVWGWNSLPGSEARGALGTVPSGLSANLYLHPSQPPPQCLRFFYHIIISLLLTPTLLSLSLQFRPPPSMDTCLSLIPMISRAVCSDHQLDRRIPGLRSAAKHNTMICATVFWRRAIYTQISSSTNVARANPIGRYTHVLSG